MTRRVRLGLWLLGGIAGAITVAVIALAAVDPRPFVLRQVTSATGRTAEMASLTIGWGNPIVVTATEFRLGNAPWGGAPELARFARLTAEIDTWKLLRGQLRFRRIAVEQPVIALERDPRRVGNWKLHPDSPATPSAPRRVEMPFIADLAVVGGEITFRTHSGAVLRIHLDELRLLAPTIDAPATVTANGSYNDLPLRLDLRTQPFAVLWQSSVPFGFDLTAKAANTELGFHGTATAPLDFDGVHGALTILCERLDDWMTVFGTPDTVPVALRIAGTLDKQGDHWRLPDVAGQLDGADLAGRLALDEGRNGSPDHFDIQLELAPLDLQSLYQRAAAGPPRAAGSQALALHVAAQPTETYDVRLNLRQARYGALPLGDVGLVAELAPARLALSDLTLRLAGGAVHATARVEPAGTGGRATLDAAITRADATAFARLAGGDATALSGRLDGAARLEMTGETTTDALAASRGQAVVGVTQGRISRDLLEKVSTNLSQIFRRGSGSAALACLLAVTNIRAGQASVAPLRLRTAEGNLFGGGSIDLGRGRIDLRLKSESKSTGFFALDLPVEITGSLANPQTGLSKNFDADAIAAQARRNTAALSADLLQAVSHNACLR